jgi:hypothetical protein
MNDKKSEWEAIREWMEELAARRRLERRQKALADAFLEKDGPAVFVLIAAPNDGNAAEQLIEMSKRGA